MSEQDRQPGPRRGPTAAQIKGDIDSGRTADKVPGHDPAAAPLGTDEEAGGARPDPETLAATRRQEQTGRPAPGSSNAATPQLQPDGRLGGQRNLVVAVVVGVLVAGLLAFLLYSVL